MIASRKLLPALVPRTRAGADGATTRRRGVLGAVLVVAAAGGTVLPSGDPAPASAAGTAPAGCVAPSAKAHGAGSAAAAVKRVVRGVSTDVAREPKIRSPKSRAPRRLVKDDVVRCGKGARASRGDTVTVRYKMVVWGGSKKVVDSSWSRTPSTAVFPLKKNALIDGWVEGMAGMRVGGRRVLVVPPSKAYGAQGTSGVPKNSTLIFVIDLVGVS